MYMHSAPFFNVDTTAMVRGLYSPPRIPRQSVRTGAESDGIRANLRGLRVSLCGLAWCQFGTGTYVTELGLRAESED